METTNNTNKTFIPGGGFIVARKSFESDLWRNHPATWWKIWCYILGHVQHEEFKELKRGQGYFNFKNLVRNKAFGVDENNVGIRYGSCDHFLRWASAANMLAKRQATWGTLITVRQYDLYQDLSNYRSEDLGEDFGELVGERSANGRRTVGEDINNNVNNGNNDLKGKGKGNSLFEQIQPKDILFEHVETRNNPPMLQKKLEAIFSEDQEDESVIPF